MGRPWGAVSKSKRWWAADQQKQTHLWLIYGMRKAKGEMERLGKHERACNTDPHLDGESQNGSGRCGGVLPSRRNRLQRRNPPP